MKETQQTVWLDMHTRFRRQIKWLSGAILLLGLTGVFDGQSNYNRLAEDYQSVVDQVIEEQIVRINAIEVRSETILA